jgi:hypothetical protein
MIHSTARLVAAYTAGIVLCLVHAVGVVCGVPLDAACGRALLAAAIAYFVMKLVATLFLRVLVRTIANAAASANETTPDDPAVSQ